MYDKHSGILLEYFVDTKTKTVSDVENSYPLSVWSFCCNKLRIFVSANVCSLKEFQQGDRDVMAQEIVNLRDKVQNKRVHVDKRFNRGATTVDDC